MLAPWGCALSSNQHVHAQTYCETPELQKLKSSNGSKCTDL